MENQNLFAMSLDSVNEEHLSFDNDMYVDGWDDASFDDNIYANGAGVVSQTSKPYIIILTNTNTVTAATAVKFLDASTALLPTTVNYGLGAGISASSGIAGTTYADVLSELVGEPMLIGKTIIQSTSNAQVQSPISVTVRKATGSSQTEVLTPTLNAFQNQSGIIELGDVYLLNRFTALTIGTIYAGTTVTIMLYPKAQGNSAGAITGKVVNKFNAPQTQGLKVIGK